MKLTTFYLDREKDMVVDVFLAGTDMTYCMRTPNHHTGNLISNLAKLCELPLSRDEHGLYIICGDIPCYVDGQNEMVYIFRLGNTKVANIFPDGRVEMKASIPAISKTLMSQTKEYHLGIEKTIVKTYIRRECKFETDLHTHMNGNLSPDVLIALGIHHQIRYPLYYVKKLRLCLTDDQWRDVMARRKKAEQAFANSGLEGKYLDRRIDDNTYINFADLILNNPEAAAENIEKIRNSLAVPKDGQAVFANLEKVYLYRYVFTKGVAYGERVNGDPSGIPNPAVAATVLRMQMDHESEAYRWNTLFQDKLLWTARFYQACGISYVEISDTTLVKPVEGVRMLSEAHQVLPSIEKETGVLIRFLAGIRRIPLTIVRDRVPKADYLSENLRILSAIREDPYVAGADILGEEINDILELKPVIKELVKIAGMDPSFVIRIHAGENDSLRDNVSNSVSCVLAALEPGQKMPLLRIGHGLYTSNLRSPKGKRLLALLREHDVTLEFQITSNVRLNNLSDLSHHPLKMYLREGIGCVQGTDGGGLYGTNSIDEELALEKFLGLTHEELVLMRKTDCRWQKSGRAAFEQKWAELPENTDIEAWLVGRIAETEPPELELSILEASVESASALAERIRPLPEGKFPIILAGGSFNNSQHRTVMRENGKAFIDALLQRADPDRVCFVVGHRVSGYERYLLQQAKGRFEIFAIVPTMITRAEAKRLREANIGIRMSIEPSGISLYKSFAYEIFKRCPSAVIALDGNSAAANLLQEAKNGKYKCRIFVDEHSQAIMTKARSLKGYVSGIDDGNAAITTLLEATERTH